MICSNLERALWSLLGDYEISDEEGVSFGRSQLESLNSCGRLRKYDEV